ncbi:helix-turn-helix domain-containing protein [Salmonella enterica]|nr:helix-turn-helix transcriptional regulator [Salmonella enterica]EKT1605354.1 helix-turn-helix transcriptional regulator [Salmonella enterica]
MVPKRLRNARKSMGYTQEQLSELIGIDGLNSSSRLSSYEVGRAEPPFNLVVKIAQVLDYPECYFYTLDDQLAQTILDIHRNKSNAVTDHYIRVLAHVKKSVHDLNLYLKKTTK